MNMKKTMLATALLAASSLAFAQGEKPATPPAGSTAPTERPATSDFGQATAERAATVGTDADARATMGADTSAAARARADVDDPVDDPIDDPIEDPIDDPIDDADGDGIPDDDDGDDDGDGEIDEWDDQPASTFGQETSDAARDADREGGLDRSDAAQERNDLRSMDTDGDGTNDYLDTDDDGDGLSDDEALDADDDVDGTVDGESDA